MPLTGLIFDAQARQANQAPFPIPVPGYTKQVEDRIALWEFNVGDFGLDGNGNDVNAAPWARMLAYIGSLAEAGRSSGIRGVKIVFGRGEFCLTNLTISSAALGWNGKIIVEGQGDQTRIFPGGGQGQALTVAAGGNPSESVVLRDFRIGYGSEVFNQPDLPYSQPIVSVVQGVTYEISGLTGFLSGTGTLLYLNTTYNGVMRSCFFNTGSYGIPVRWDNQAGATDNDTISFRDVVMEGMYGAVMDLGNGLVETIRLDQYKWLTGDIGGASSNWAESFLASASLAGSSTITLNAGDGALFSVGDSIAIGEGALGRAAGYGFEVAKVTQINSDTLTLSWPLQFTHDPVNHRVQIMRGGIGFVVPISTKLLKITGSHFEHGSIGVWAFGGTVIELDHVTGTVPSLIRIGGGSSDIAGLSELLVGVVESLGNALRGGGNQNYVVDIPSWVPSVYTNASAPRRLMIDGPLINQGAIPSQVNLNGTSYAIDEFGYLALTLAAGFAQGAYQAFGVKSGRDGIKIKGMLSMAAVVAAGSPIFTLPSVLVPFRSALFSILQTNAQNFAAVPASNWCRLRGIDQVSPGECDLLLATTAAGWLDFAATGPIPFHS